MGPKMCIGAIHNYSMLPECVPTKSNSSGGPYLQARRHLRITPGSPLPLFSEFSWPSIMIPLHTWLSVVLAVFTIGNTSMLAGAAPSPVALIFKKATTEKRLVPYVEGHCNSVEIDTPNLLQAEDLRDVAFANMHNEIVFGVAWKKGIWIGRVDSSLEHAVYGYHLQRVPKEGNEEETILEEQIIQPLIGNTPCEDSQESLWEADSKPRTLSKAWALWNTRGVTVDTGDEATDVKGFIWAPQKRLADRSYVDGFANPHLVEILRSSMRAEIGENLPISEIPFKRSPTTNPDKISRAWLLGARFQRDVHEADIASVVYIGGETIHKYGQIPKPE